MAMTIRRSAAFNVFAGVIAAALATCIYTRSPAAQGPVDPGVRGGAPGAGTPLDSLTADETAFFQDGLAKFLDIESVTGGHNNGLGPRFNSNQCLSCHTQPSVGGTSPATNPLIGIATLDGARNVVPWFITQNGPIREAHLKRPLGIFGHPNAHLSGNANRSANDGTITRFGWKAQNKSLLLFAGEAYNVEMGVTNQLFPQERDETPGCLFNATPEDTLNFTTTSTPTSNPNTAVLSDTEA